MDDPEDGSTPQAAQILPLPWCKICVLLLLGYEVVLNGGLIA
jgi:hypothetical protein